MDLQEILSWLGFALRLLVSLGILGLALAVVRPKLPRAGWALSAAAGIDLLSMCCSRAGWRSLRSIDDYDVMSAVTTGLGLMELVTTFLVGAATIAALALLAADAKKSAAPSK